MNGNLHKFLSRGAGRSANGGKTVTAGSSSAPGEPLSARNRTKILLRRSSIARERGYEGPKLGTFVKTTDEEWTSRAQVQLVDRSTTMRPENQGPRVEQLVRGTRQEQETRMNTPVAVRPLRALRAVSGVLFRLSEEPGGEEQEQAPIIASIITPIIAPIIEEATPQTADGKDLCYHCMIAAESCSNHQSSMDSTDLALPVMFEEDPADGAESVMDDAGQQFSSDPLWSEQNYAASEEEPEEI